jgi:hypothetical protein
MSESGDYEVAHWSPGHNFASARRAYRDDVVDRSYGKAVAAGKKARDLVEPRIVSDAKRSLILVTDHTGSMGERTGIIFSKYPYLVHEVQTEYFGPDSDICIAAVGDACGDNYPLEVRPLAKDKKDLEVRLKELVIEGNGQGGGTESYELAGLYFCRNASYPKALHKPVIIFTGDEQPKDQVTKEQAKEYALVNLEKAISTEAIFRELKEKYEVYYILNPYNSAKLVGDRLDGNSQSFYDRWCKLLGSDHVVILGDPDRVVDVIFGILAKETKKIEYFKEEIEDRQKPAQVATVYKALKTIHALPAPEDEKSAKTGASKLRSGGKGPKSKPLM